VKIGEGTFVAGGTFLTEDVPASSFVRMKEGKVVVTENRIKAPGAEERTRYRL
jgi:acetyltransferase-like isoleucine patch superfamily enzyme